MHRASLPAVQEAFMDTIQQQKEALRRELAAAERAMMPEEKRLSDGGIPAYSVHGGE